MKNIIVIFLLSSILYEAFSAKTAPRNGAKRSFKNKIRTLFDAVAVANKYQISPRNFDLCHIVPAKFINKMVDQYSNKQISTIKMNKFINDLAKVEKKAAFYYLSPLPTKLDLETLTQENKEEAIDFMNKGNIEGLKEALYNMPSNLFPGSSSINRSIQDNIDPPKVMGPDGRLNEATSNAKELYENYKEDGLTKVNKEGDTTMAKSSDSPPGDDSDLYVKM